jgi:hypothetical protein
MGLSLLEQLEAQLTTLPPGATKHEMEAGYEVMAKWIQTLPTVDRAEILAALPAWLADAAPYWHPVAVMEVAVRLRDKQLLDSAIQKAQEVGIHDLAAPVEYPPWLSFDLHLLSAISRWQGDPGEKAREYLESVRAGATGAVSYSRRLLGIRAWFTKCLLDASNRMTCLRDGLGVLRAWRDDRLLRSGLSLLHAYFALTPEGLADLRELLTPDELAIAACESPQNSAR